MSNFPTKHGYIVLTMCALFIMCCSTAMAQNTSDDPSPDEETAGYITLGLNSDVVAVSSAITGVATIYESDGSEDSDDSITASSSVGSNSGNGHVSFNFTAPDSAGDVKITASSQDAPDKSAPAHVIGGPVTGDNDVKYFCVPEDQSLHGHLNAADGQPAGTAYSWAIIGYGVYCDASGNPLTSSTGSSAEFRGVMPGSTNKGDVIALVTYSLNGKSVTSPEYPITVRCPKTFEKLLTNPPTAIKPPDASAYGFKDQQLFFIVKDGLGDPMDGTNWNETFTNATPASALVPTPGTSGLSKQYNIDQFSISNYPKPSNPAGDLQLTVTHTYYVGSSTSGKGCQIQQYNNVKYYTYGVTGNGF